jgi:hypothetical protein
MNPTSFRYAWLPLLAVCAVSSTQAALIVSENFDYPVGTVEAPRTLSDIDGAGTDANGGTGFSGAWNNSRVDSIVAGLTDSRSASSDGGSGGAALVSINTTGRVWDGTSFGGNGSVIWFSILISTTEPTFNGAFASRMMLFSTGPGMSSNNGFGFELGAANGTTGNIVARLGNANSGTVATYNQGQTNFVLGRYVNNAGFELGDFDALDLWINPSQGELDAFSISGVLADLGTVDSSLSVVSTTVNFSDTSGVYLRASNSATTNWTADELRIGTTLADVAASAVPEPASAAMLAGLAGLGLVLARRRRV